MARTRSIKPDFFTDPTVGDLSPFARLLFIGLWTEADREGRLVYEPRQLAVRLFPYDAGVDIPSLTAELVNACLVTVYHDEPDLGDARPDLGDARSRQKRYLHVSNFSKHQHPHIRENASVLPKPVQGRAQPSASPVLGDARPDLGDAQPGGSGSGSGSSTHTPTASARVPIAGYRNEHRTHAECGRVCLPAFLFSEFVRRRGTPDADAVVRQWAGEVLVAWRERAEEPGDALAFWRARYDERWPSHGAQKKPTSTGPAVPSVEATKKAMESWG